ncbi:MAG: response regulator, partial [Rhodospirillales bacterium]|nr:response regulator [Rhodospirillales bacterium]
MTVQSSSPTPPSIRLLLIEDDLGDAMLVRYALKNAGSRFHLTHTASLKEAAAWLEGNVCDVILLDLSLPDSFGLATITKIRALAPHVPVIVLTGHADEDFACNAVEAGTQDYLVKGQTEGDVLARAIRYALLRKQMEDRLRASEEKLKAII